MRMEQGWARSRTGSGLKPILAGSDWIELQFFLIGVSGVRTGSDWENLLFWCDYSNHIQHVSCAVMWFCRLVKWQCIFCHQWQKLCCRGDEPICYRGPLCQLPLSNRATQLFSHTTNPVKTKKIVHQQKQTTNESNKKFKTADLVWMLCGPHEILLRAALCLKLCAVLTYLDLKMGNNKTENTKKQGKREKTAATPNKGKQQTTETAGNYEACQPLTPQNRLATLRKCWKKQVHLMQRCLALKHYPNKCVI